MLNPPYPYKTAAPGGAVRSATLALGPMMNIGTRVPSLLGTKTCLATMSSAG